MAHRPSPKWRLVPRLCGFGFRDRMVRSPTRSQFPGLPQVKSTMIGTPRFILRLMQFEKPRCRQRIRSEPTGFPIDAWDARPGAEKFAPRREEPKKGRHHVVAALCGLLRRGFLRCSLSGLSNSGKPFVLAPSWKRRGRLPFVRVRALLGARQNNSQSPGTRTCKHPEAHTGDRKLMAIVRRATAPNGAKVER